MGCGQKIFFFLILKQKSQESGENGLVVSFCSDENVQKLWWWLHYGEYSKKHWIVYFKLVNCMECESQWTPGVGDGQGGLVCGDSWGRKELDRLSDWSDLVAQTVKNLPAMHKSWVQSLGQKDPMEKRMATHCSSLALRIPWTEEPGRPQSMGLKESDTTEQLTPWGTGGTSV